MIKNNSGETLVGILIGVAILSIIILGITNLLINSSNSINIYYNKNIINSIKISTTNIVKKIDTSNVKETEIFYLYKNHDSNKFELFTGATNNTYKYIDQYGEHIDNIETYSGRYIYSRILWLERDDNSIGDTHQIIKASVKRLIKRD